jgi:hypothetical protein
MNDAHGRQVSPTDSRGRDGAPPEKVVVVHFPKAGGASLLTQLMTLLPGEVELDYDHDPLIDPGSGEAPFPAGKRIVHGHFRPQRYAGARAFMATFLRDPVENLLSIYFFWRGLVYQGNPVHARFLSEKPDIFAFARYPEFEVLMSETYFGGFDMKRFDFIGFHERRRSDVARLGRELGLTLSGDVHENSTARSDERQQLGQNPAAIGRLRGLLDKDVRFYEKLRAAAG